MDSFSSFCAAGILSSTLVAASGAAAAPLVLDFAFDSDGYEATRAAAEAAGVVIDEDNYGSYNYVGDVLTLGNDGLSNTATFTAVPGRVFDVLSLNLLSLAGELTVVSCDGIETCDDPDSMASLSVVRMPDLFLDGYRAGTDPVATAVLKTLAPGMLDISGLGGFTALTRLEVSISLAGYGGWDWQFDPRANGWVFCDGGPSCGLAILDDLSLDLRPAGGGTPVGAVPLPAAAGLLGAAVTGLGVLRAIRRKTPG